MHAQFRHASTFPTKAVWIIFALLLLAWIVVGASYRTQRVAALRNGVVADARTVGTRFVGALERRVATLESLWAFSEAQLSENDDPGASFDRFARNLTIGLDGIDSIGLAPNGVLRHIHPSRHEQTLIGFNLLSADDERFRETARMAWESDEIIISPPRDLLTGGYGFAVERTIRDHRGERWGLAITAIHIEGLFEDVLSTSDLDRISLEIRTHLGDLVLSTGGLYSDDPVVSEFEVFGNLWKVAAAPVGGWSGAFRQAQVRFDLIAAALFALIASLTFLLGNRVKSLAETDELRVGELEQAHSDLRDEMARRSRSDSVLERIFENSFDSVVAIDDSDRLMRTNPAFLDALSWTTSDLARLSWVDLVHPDDRQRSDEAFAQVREGIRVRELELRCLTKFGGYQWISWNIIHDAPSATAFALGRDVSVQKLIDRQREEHQSYIERIIDGMTEVYLELDTGGYIRNANQRAECFFAQKREDFVGQRIWSIAPDLLESDFRVELLKVFARTSGHEFECYIPSRRQWITAHAYPTEGGATLYFQDVTLNREYQAELTRSIQEKELLLREVHHRVKNNLQVISSLTSLYSVRMENHGDSGRLLELRAKIQSMAAVHETIYQSDHFDRVEMQSYFEGVARNYQNVYADTSTVRIRVYCSPIALPLDQAVPCGLIVAELIGNAMKHAFPDHPDNARITIALERANTSYVLQVSDNGVGSEGSGSDDDIEDQGIGLRIVDALTSQLAGVLLSSANASSGAPSTGAAHAVSAGSRISIRFPVNDEDSRGPTHVLSSQNTDASLNRADSDSATDPDSELGDSAG